MRSRSADSVTRQGRVAAEVRDFPLQALTIDPERILALYAVGIFGNGVPDHCIMSRRQRRRQGHDELLLILWIIQRRASGNCFPSFILEFQTREFRYHAFAEIQLDL